MLLFLSRCVPLKVKTPAVQKPVRLINEVNFSGGGAGSCLTTEEFGFFFPRVGLPG